MFRYLCCVVCALVLSVTVGSGQSLLNQQLKYERVRTAKAEKDSLLRSLFESKGIAYPPGDLFIRVFKSEMLLELWGRSKPEDPYTLIKCYPVCATSGIPGPKRQEGDLQIPEGFYRISIFNPTSTFYLSLGIDYPNKSDRILGVRGNLGGAIMIHGECVTIGCIPIQNEAIKELYWACLLAQSEGQKDIPVHIFPLMMDSTGMSLLRSRWENDSTRLGFWENLRTGFQMFESSRALPSISVDASGRYVLR